MQRGKNMASKSRPSIVEVTWLDAITSSVGYGMSVKAAKDTTLAVRRSVGYHLLTNKDKIVICSVWDEEDGDGAPSVSEVTVIPHTWIVKVKTVQRIQTVKKK